MLRTTFGGKRTNATDLVGLAKLYELHGAAAYGLALRLAGDEAAAEEVVGRSFIELWERGPELAAAGIPAGSWLFEAVRRRSLGLPPQVLTLGIPRDPSAPPEAVRRALGNLPDDLRDLLHAVAFDGAPPAAVASRRQLPLAELRHQLRIGLEKLASGIEGQLESHRLADSRAAAPKLA